MASPAQPGRYSREHFDQLVAKVKNWGRWGTDDELGTLNFLTGERVIEAMRSVRHGESVSCALDLATTPAVDNAHPVRHFTYWHDREEAMQVVLEHVTLDAHGFCVTHLDAMNHIFRDRQMYNGRSWDEVSPGGVQGNSILAARNGIVGRGILVDLAKAAGRDYLDPGDVASFDDFQRALELAGSEPRSGDILLLRMGRYRRDRELGTPAPAEGLAGLSLECVEWVHDNEIAAIVCDGGTDSQPSEVTGVRMPWHILTLTMMGLLIVDNADLEPLAEACSRHDQHDMLVVLAPLRLAGGSSSPVNPIAVL